MYAHQVIEDFSIVAKKYGEKSVVLMDAIKIVQNKIASAQKFHLGETNWDNLLPEDLRCHNCLSTFWRSNFQWPQDARVPYDVCWMDSVFRKGTTLDFDEDRNTERRKSPSRYGFLTILDGDILHVIGVMLSLSTQLWVPSSVRFAIDLTGAVSVIDGYYRIGSGCLFCKFNWPQETRLKDGPALDSYNLRLLIAGLFLLNAKNIGTEINYPDAKLQKARKKRGKLPFFSYHTLVIKPTGKRQGSIPKHLWDNRVHLCRGHFKTYTEEKPLFGHITGRFWWQPSVRGNNKEGIIVKDYKIDGRAAETLVRTL